MANYYCEFSTLVPFPNTTPTQMQKILDDILLDIVDRDDWYGGCSFSVESKEDGCEVWVRSQDAEGDVEVATEVIQKLLEKFNIDKYHFFTWANTCSKLRPDSFGGGAALVGSDEVRALNTDELATILENGGPI